MNRRIRPMLTVMRKELRDFYRDRKTFLMTLLLAPLMYPVLMIGLGTLAEGRAKTQLEKPMTVPVAGGEHAPTLLAFLKSQGIEARSASEAAVERAIREQSSDVGLVVGGDFVEAWRAGTPAKVEIVLDSTRRDAELPGKRVQTALEGYSNVVGALRLLGRGINPQVARPLDAARRDLATPEARRGIILSVMLPIIMLIFAFIGGAHLAMDTTAGERERQSLEPLLATPAARGTIVSGKMLAAGLVGLTGLLLILLSFKLSATLVPGIGRMLNVSPLAIAQLLLVLLPLTLLGTAMLTFLAAGAKSMKEAQAHMTWLMFLPMLPAYVLMVRPLKDTELWQYAVPFLSQNQLVQKITRGESPSAQQWGVYLACALGLALLVWLAATWRYRQEKLAISA